MLFIYDYLDVYNNQKYLKRDFFNEARLKKKN